MLNEIEETLQREAREGGAEVLIPIRLDDYVFSDWAPEAPAASDATFVALGDADAKVNNS